MGQISSALKSFRAAVESLRGSKTPNACLGPDAQSHVPPPQAAVLTLETALETSENSVQLSREPNVASVCPQHDNQPHIPPPEDNCIIRTSYEKHEPLSSGEDNSSVRRSYMPKAAGLGPFQNSLSDLPTELLLLVARHLAPSSLMSLTYSCRSIHNKMGVSIEHSLGKKNEIARLSEFALSANLPKSTLTRRAVIWTMPPTVAPNTYRSERLKLLYMLDRDQNIPPSKAVCSGCADTHDRSLFSSESLAQPSSQRRCLGSAGRLWICPHWIFDHNLVTTSAAPKGIHMCGIRKVFMLAVDHRTTEPTVIWPIAVLRDKRDAPSNEFVEDILGHMNVSICKHLRSSDAFVSRLYSPDCEKLRGKGELPPYCRCSSCAWQLSHPVPAEYPGLFRSLFTGGHCESCGTEVHFCISAYSDSGWMLELVVKKKIRSFRGCTDRAWIEQVTNPVEFEGLERKWYAATNVPAPHVDSDRMSISTDPVEANQFSIPNLKKSRSSF